MRLHKIVLFLLVNILCSVWSIKIGMFWPWGLGAMLPDKPPSHRYPIFWGDFDYEELSEDASVRPHVPVPVYRDYVLKIVPKTPPIYHKTNHFK
ncbi:unnamed protein product [Allacma fusca]|uniref:Uncharacterized protein n=1 Tax=Allacma fusca TaxID=39272 RepID=A0A8J2KIA0_9HEXA|nr:unnamed protein product [Allacma fusca]